MNRHDVRWMQRLENLKKALAQLEEAVELRRKRPLSRLETQGLIQAFEFTHELAWNTIKDFFEFQGTIGIMGSRDASREAFQKGLISEGELWMEMIKSRNLSTHTYNENIAQEISEKIASSYLAAFSSLVRTLETRKS